MGSRYAPAIAALGGVLGLATAGGEWPAAIPTVGEVAAAPVVLGLLVVVLALARIGVSPAYRGLIVAIGIGGILFIVLGAFGYWQFLIGEVEGILTAVVSVFAGAIILTMAIADRAEISSDDAIQRTAAVGKGAAIAVVGFVAIVGWLVFLGMFLVGVLGFELSEMQEVFLSTVSLGLGLGTVSILYLLLGRHTWSFIDLRRPGLRDAVWTLGGIIALFVGLIAVVQLLSVLNVSTPQHGIVEIAVEGDPRILLLLVPASFLLIGPAEELLFRNIIQKSLYAHFTPAAAIVITSVLFAGAHFPAYGGRADAVGPMLVIFVLSLILGAIYRRTDNIVVPTIVHGAFNAIQFAALYVVITSENGLAWLVFIG